jgi:AcrR family transcriptional regulator
MADSDLNMGSKARRYKPAETRQRIVDAAGKLFMEHGYAATSTADLADAAGVAEGSIFYHFGSKRALLEALGKKYAEGMVAAMLGDASQTDDIDAGDMIHRCFDYCRVAGNPKDMIGIDIYSGDGEGFENASRSVVLNFIETVMAANYSKRGLPLEHVQLIAAMSYAAVHDAIMRAHRDGVTEDDYQLIKHVAADYVRAQAGVTQLR